LLLRKRLIGDSLDSATCTVRRASVAEAADVFALVEEYYDAVSVVARDNRAKLLDCVTRAEGGVWLAYSGAESIGCILYHSLPNIGSAGEVKRLYVRPPFRRQRIAQELLDNLERFALSRGDVWLYLDTNESLQAAIAFYRRNGYIPCARYNDNPQATIFMRKRLPSGGR
jgi:GNAT superfamily N-acetyltransferase